MEKYYKRKPTDTSSEFPESESQPNANVRPRLEINLDELPIDPAKRKSMDSFDVNDRDKVRRFYWQNGPFQPEIDFPWRQYGNQERRRFNFSWFKKYPSWLEYSISEDSTYCLCCYLFKPNHGHRGGGSTFVSEGFTLWKSSLKSFGEHIGDHNSVHNRCVKACQDLMNQKQHIEICITNQTEQDQINYRTRLVASIDVIRMCLSQALAFRGHNESKESKNRGNFITFLQFLADHNEEVRTVVLDRAPENNKLTSPDIQKDIVNAIALETTKIILQDLGDDYFSILVDESRDISIKEQMVVLVRFVDKKGCIVERFLGVVHVRDTTAISLKVGVEELLAKNGLCIAKIRGQGYDGASNMRGEFNGLKSLILKENPCAFYVHCFAHQLQLALIALVKNDGKVATFFFKISQIVNVVSGSCKRQDLLRDKQTEQVVEGICRGDIETGRGLNQESTLSRAGDTRWGSHYLTLCSLIELFNPVLDVLEHIYKTTKESELRGNAGLMLENMKNFEFVFYLHFMRAVLAISDGLSQALQKKDQDIVNAIGLVSSTKKTFKKLREHGWEDLLNEISLFCEHEKRCIEIVDMSEPFSNSRRSLRKPEQLTNLHYYRFDKFNAVLDRLIQELDDRFGEISTELLSGMACLSPHNSFCAFDKDKIISFAKLYPLEFRSGDITGLVWALETYFEDVSNDYRFLGLHGLSDLGKKLVETRKHIIHPLVFSLLKLAMLLPVATAGVERAFSAMTIIKTKLRNRIGDEWLNDLLVTYIERDISLSLKNEDIIKRFQKMKTRRFAL